MGDVLTPDALGAMPIYGTYGVERGRVIVAADPAAMRGASMVLFEGRGLRRGIAYETPDVERGYLTGAMGAGCRLIDATTGRIVHVHADECREIEARYRWRSVRDATD